MCACVRLLIWNGLAIHWTIFKFSKWIEFCIIISFFLLFFLLVYVSLNHWRKKIKKIVWRRRKICRRKRQTLPMYVQISWCVLCGKVHWISIWFGRKFYFGKVAEKKTSDTYKHTYVRTYTHTHKVCIWNGCCEKEVLIGGVCAWITVQHSSQNETFHIYSSPHFYKITKIYTHTYTYVYVFNKWFLLKQKHKTDTESERKSVCVRKKKISHI